MIVGLYLITPFLRILIRHWRKKDYLYFLILWFIVFSLLPFLQDILHINIAFSSSVILQFVGYYILGYLINNQNLERKRFTYCLLLFGISLIATITTLYVINMNLDMVNYALLTYYAPNILVLSVTGYLLLKTMGERWETLVSQRTKDAMKLLSGMSFGIFLIHSIIVESIKAGYIGFSFTSVAFHPLLAIPCMVIFVWTISFTIVFILKKTPILKVIVP